MYYDPSEIPLHPSQLKRLMEDLQRTHYTLTNTPIATHQPLTIPNTPNTHSHTYESHNHTTIHVAVPSPPPPPQGYALDDGGSNRNGFERFRHSETSYLCSSQEEGDAGRQPIETPDQGEPRSLSASMPGPSTHLRMEHSQAPAQAQREPIVPPCDPNHNASWLVHNADSEAYRYQFQPMTTNQTAGAATNPGLHKRARTHAHSSLPSHSPSNAPSSSSHSTPSYAIPRPNHSPLPEHMDSGMGRASVLPLFAGTEAMDRALKTINGAHHLRSMSDPTILSMNTAQRDYFASRPSLAAQGASTPISLHEHARHDAHSTFQPAHAIFSSPSAQQQQVALPIPMAALERPVLAESWTEPPGSGMIDTRNHRVCPASQRPNEQSDGQAAFESTNLTRRLDGDNRENAQLACPLDAQSQQLYDWYSRSQSGLHGPSSTRPGVYEEYGHQMSQQSAGVASSPGSSPAIQLGGSIPERARELTSGIWKGGERTDASLSSVPLSSVPTMQGHDTSLLFGMVDSMLALQNATVYADSPVDSSTTLYAMPNAHSPHPVSNISSPYSGSHSPIAYSNVQSPFTQRGYTPASYITTPPPSGTFSLPWHKSNTYRHQRPISHSRHGSHHGSLTTSPMIRPYPGSLSVSPVIHSAPLFGRFNHSVPSLTSYSNTFPMPDIPNWSPPLTAGHFAHPRSQERFIGFDDPLWNGTFNPIDRPFAPGAHDHARSTTPFGDEPPPSNPTNPKPNRPVSSPLVEQDAHDLVNVVPSPSSFSDNEEVADAGEVDAMDATPSLFPDTLPSTLPTGGSEPRLEAESEPDKDTFVSLPSIPRATVDQVMAFIERSFPLGTPNCAVRRRALRTVLFSEWKALDVKEPSPKVLTQFVDAVTVPIPSSSATGTSSSKGKKRSSSAATTAGAAAKKNKKRWRCGFYLDRVDEMGNQVRCPCGSVRSVQALEHIRRHIKLEPFVCEGEHCPESLTGCGARYSSLDPLRKHRGGKNTCKICLRGVLPGNMKRHLDNNCHEDTP